MKPTNYHQRVIRSALWSAYGDALGFITELRDNRRGIVSRIGTERATHTLEWKRRIGGRFGVEVVLPAGCYSDDTQLRLATCRAIRPDGSFDVEAFAKMELPVWMSYALGAGRGSKAAALALSRDGVTWFSNFYASEGLSYFSGGGNGATMRIQPHIWAAKDHQSQDEIVAAILRNSICTHGHVRGIAGAVFHGLCPHHARLYDVSPNYDVLEGIADYIPSIARLVEDDPDIKTFWLPVWEQRSGGRFVDACRTVRQEVLDDINALREMPPCEDMEVSYELALRKLGALSDGARGSGTKTAILASYLTHLGKDTDPNDVIICAANALASDTDTIATMAGAILGYITEKMPADSLQDRNYIERQAERMASLAMGKPTHQTDYPNLLSWSPPKTQQDSVVLGKEGLEVLVLGRVAEQGQVFEAKKSDVSFWQWLTLESGQTIIAKRRKEPFKVKDHQRPKPSLKPNSPDDDALAPQLQLPLPLLSQIVDEIADIYDLTRRAIQSQFDPTVIGGDILRLCSAPQGIEKAIAYTAIIAKAKVARAKRSS